MVNINSINITPPLINSSCAWASDLQQLEELYDCPHIGAVTTRTATNVGFLEDETHVVDFTSNTFPSINSYGYSPHPLSTYLSWIETIFTSPERIQSEKPFIISITTSDPQTLQSMVQSIQSLRNRIGDTGAKKLSRLAVELNTSCPNIPNSSPSGYSFPSLQPLLRVLASEIGQDPSLTVGLKLPPFTYKEQFEAVCIGLESLDTSVLKKSPISFITCTNTLGNSLLFSEQMLPSSVERKHFAIPTALGGLAGDLLHPLALGNVHTFSQMLSLQSSHDAGLGHIKVIGVGGVTSKAALKRMENAGASVVGCATLFGREGVQAFAKLRDND